MKAGKLTRLECDAALERLTVTTDMGDLADRDLVIDAATENAEVKTALFAEKARGFVTSVLGKTSISAPDRAGFVVNALLVPYLLSAIRMLEAGHATALHAAPPLLRRMTAAGLLGRKSGRGFFDYPER